MLYRSKFILASIRNTFRQVHLQYSTKTIPDTFFLTPEQRLKVLRQMAKPMARENPVIMQLDSPEFHSIFTDELRKLASLFKENGFEIRVAGGAVRDLLMGKKPVDLDFATTATPAQMKDMFITEDIRMINMNGEKHGTITPRINDKENFEVTTLRIDVVTDGRHAEVQFTTDWLLDALRRDLTINSMFLGLDGSVYDYFYGYDDLKKHRVAFVGDAATRIQEDYLRIMRYFRFYGRISLTANNHEEETIRVIKENASGLSRVSGERIWTELRKILEGNYAGELLATLVECGIAPYIGLPENSNLEELRRVWKKSGQLNLHPITLISSLLNTEEDAVTLNSRLKLSVYERELALFIVQHRSPKLHPNPLLPYKQIIVTTKSKPLVVQKMAVEVLKYNNSPHWQELEEWSILQFPVTGRMLKEKGVESGKIMGLVIGELKQSWADSNFTLSPEQLLEEVPRVLDRLAERRRKK